MAIRAGDSVVHVDGSWPSAETVKNVSVQSGFRGPEEFAFFEGGGWWRTKSLVVAHDCDGDINCTACNRASESDPDAATGCADDQDFTAADVDVIKANLREVSE